MRSVLLLGLLVVTGCVVDDVTVLGDARAAAACASAEVIAVPPVGCTTARVVSSGPYGCSFAASGSSFAGSWVRVSGERGLATITVHAVEPSASCAADGGTADGGGVDCATRVWVDFEGSTPCNCDAAAVLPEEHGVVEVGLLADETQLLLQPFGATFDVSVCRTGP